MPACFRSSGRTPTLCIGSDASCAAEPGASDKNAAAAASDASSAKRKPNLRDTDTLLPPLLGHFVIFIALQHVTAWASLVLVGNIGRKRRGIADARGNVCGS